MSPRARQTLLGGIAISAAGWCAVTYLGGGPQVAQATRAPDEPAVAYVAATDGAAPALALPDDLPWPPDPFRLAAPPVAPVEATNMSPLGVSDSTARQYVLNAILDGENPRAIVDGRVVAVGDRLPGGELIVAIDALSVTVTAAAGDRTVLGLPE